jgi:hypothetical protein
MSSVYRRITILLAVACLGAGLPATAAYAQGAGDQQYQDPFGGSGSGSSGSGSSGSGSSGSGAPTQSLSSAPQTQAAPGSSTAAAPTPTAAAQTSGAGTLPRTGLDARLILAAGAVLLLTGLGLRLRSTADRS